MKEVIAHDAIECPYCGKLHGDYHDYIEPADEGGEFDMECEKCGEWFDVDFFTTITFSTTTK